MNRQRRKEIDDVIARINTLKEEADKIKDAIENLRDEEQEYFDEMPENFQYGEKGERAEEAISHLEDAENNLDYVDFDEVIGSLEEAKQ